MGGAWDSPGQVGSYEDLTRIAVTCNTLVLISHHSIHQCIVNKIKNRIKNTKSWEKLNHEAK
jgi:hypothetical protein